MYSNESLVPTTENMVKEGINDMKKTECGGISHHSSQGKNRIDTVNKTDKPQSSKSKNINL